MLARSCRTVVPDRLAQVGDERVRDAVVARRGHHVQPALLAVEVPAPVVHHVADRAETRAQSHWLADKLKEAGVPAQVVAAEGTTHATINANLGLPDDRPSQEMWQFLARALKKR